MALTAIEITALIIALVAAIKILVILIKPKAWMSVVKAIYSIPVLTMIVALILAAIVLNYLLAEITITQIFGAMALFALLAAIGIAAYGKEIVALGSKMLRDRNIVKKAWLAIIVWIVLIIWVLTEIF